MNKLAKVDKHTDILSILPIILPSFRCFETSLKAVNIDVVCSRSNEKYLSLFDNKDNFFYDINAIDRNLTNIEFKQIHNILTKSLVYFTQTWREWIRIGRNKIHKNGSKMSVHNAIIYCVFTNDENDVFPFAYICEMNDVKSFDEADEHIEKGILDHIVDLYSITVGIDCQVMAIVPISNIFDSSRKNIQ